MKNKKVVVTGGCGFIGSNLAEELSKDNVKLVKGLKHFGSLASGTIPEEERLTVEEIKAIRERLKKLGYL